MSRLPFDSAVATGRGDDGTTGLLFGGERVRKDDLRTEAFGTVDEAVAALGLARAALAEADASSAPAPAFAGLADLVLWIQRDLFVVGAELATTPEARERQRDGETRVSLSMMDGLNAILREMETSIELPREFVIPGETRASAAIEMARTILRRAERRIVTLAFDDEALAAGQLLPFVNRLADLLWILARVSERREARPAIPARLGRGETAPS